MLVTALRAVSTLKSNWLEPRQKENPALLPPCLRPAVRAPALTEAALLEQVRTAESSQAALTAHPLAAPVHVAEGSLAQHTCTHTTHHAYELHSGVYQTISSRMNRLHGKLYWISQVITHARDKYTNVISERTLYCTSFFNQ